MLEIQCRQPELTLAQFTWRDFKCLVTYNEMGYRCGYIRVEPGHPWHGQDTYTIGANCHGGLTFAEEDTDDQSWWLGFDCGHVCDAPDPELLKLSYSRYILPGAQIRSTWYVMQELILLADQARAATNLNPN